MGRSANAATQQDKDADLATKQEPVTVNLAGHEMQGIMHRLQASSAGPRPAVAIVQGVAGESGESASSGRASSERADQALAHLAEAIARVNMVALRLTMRGRRDPSANDQVHDARQALDLLSHQQDIDIDHLAIVGTGWHVAAAACLARYEPRLAGMVIWGPAGSPVSDERAAAQPDGCEAFYQGQAPRALPAKVLVIHGSSDKAPPDKAPPPEHAQPLAQTLEDAGIVAESMLIDVPESDAGSAHWADGVVEQMVQWLQGALMQGE